MGRYTAIGCAQRLFVAVSRAIGLEPMVRRSLVSYEVRENIVEFPSGVLAGMLRILHLSDLHADGIPDACDRLVSLLRGLRCDVCVITGDFTDPAVNSIAVARERLSRIRDAVAAEAGVYAVLGDHDPEEIRGVPERPRHARSRKRQI